MSEVVFSYTYLQGLGREAKVRHSSHVVRFCTLSEPVCAVPPVYCIKLIRVGRSSSSVPQTESVFAFQFLGCEDQPPAVTRCALGKCEVQLAGYLLRTRIRPSSSPSISG